MHDTTVQHLRSIAGLATPMALRVAATLRLADHVPADGATAADLAERARADPAAMSRLLDHLVTVGVLTVADGRYRTTPLGDALRTDADNELLSELDISSAIGRAELAFVELLHTVETGEAGYPRRYGRDFWADLAANPALQESFDSKMSGRLREHTAEIARRFDWSRFRRIVDVGGGEGTLLAAILREHPGVHGRLLDVATTAERARERFAAADLAARAEVVAGSFFDPLPGGADAYVLSDILHDWDDVHAHRILHRCREAAGTDGSVLVVEPVRGYGANTAIDLSMLVFFGGRERSIDELAALASPHGLRVGATVPVSGSRFLVELVPEDGCR